MKSLRQGPAVGEEAAADGVLFLREQQMRLAQELMVLAWRDLGRVVAPVLEELELGVAQYRVLQMLALHPDLTVGALQDVLGVAKQSLARTLTELQARGLVMSEAGKRDRRLRFLRLTEAGRTVEARLFAAQRERLVRAYREAGGNAVLGFRQVLRGMLSEESRSFLAREAGGKETGGRDAGGGRVQDGM